MDSNTTEYSKPTGNTIKEGCVHENDIRQSQTMNNQHGENTDEETSKPKKKNRSEKQKERTRQYKKKIRKERRKMKAEMKMEEINTNVCQLVAHIRPVEANEVETRAAGADVLSLRETPIKLVSTKIDECSDCLCETSRMNIHQRQIIEYKDVENTAENTNTAKKKNRSEKQKERVRQYKKKIRQERRKMIADKKKEEISNTADQIFADMIAKKKKEEMNNTADQIAVDMMAEKKKEEISNSADQIAADIRLLDVNGVAETEPTGTDALITPEPVFIQLIPADIERGTVDSPTEATSDKDDGLFPDNSTTDNDDVFGILSIYVESGLHFEFDKDYCDKTRNDDDFGYLYFSMSDFLKS